MNELIRKGVNYVAPKFLDKKRVKTVNKIMNTMSNPRLNRSQQIHKTLKQVKKLFSDSDDNVVSFSLRDVRDDLQKVSAATGKYLLAPSKDKSDRIYLTKTDKNGKVKYQRNIFGMKKYYTKTNAEKLAENLMKLKDTVSNSYNTIKGLDDNEE